MIEAGGVCREMLSIVSARDRCYDETFSLLIGAYCHGGSSGLIDQVMTRAEAAFRSALRRHSRWGW